MRVGQNPEKFKEDELRHCMHRVIIPVYIPNQEGYFQSALPIFEKSLKSLIDTVGEETRITIINNNSIEEVDNLCRRFVAEKKIDRYILNQENRGKAEGVLAAARGSWEEFITISDADIFFFEGWLENVAEAFRLFPKLGVIGLLTAPASTYRASSSTLLDCLFSFKLRIGKVISKKTILAFTHSAGLDGTKAEKEMLACPHFYVRRGDKIFMLGANHAVATYRREIFFFDIGEKVRYPFRRKSQLIKRYFDVPSDKMGLYRLSFQESQAYHMGNTLDNGGLNTAIADSAGVFPAKAVFPDRKIQRSWIRFLLPYPVRNYIVSMFLYAFRRHFRRRGGSMLKQQKEVS